MKMRNGVVVLLGLFFLMSGSAAQDKADDALAKAFKEADLIVMGKIGKVNPLGQTNSIPPSIFGTIMFKDAKALRGPALESGTFNYGFREGRKNMDLEAKGQVLVAVKQKGVLVIVPATDANLAIAKKVIGDAKSEDKK